MIALLGFVYPRLISTAAGWDAVIAPQRRPPIRRRREAKVMEQASRVDYRKFSHRQHRLACDSCHKFPAANWKEVRRGKEAFPDVTDYPDHPSCLKCHYQQFFARERPAPAICSVCHTNVSPRNSERFPFPSLDESFKASKRGQDFVSEFRVNFPHETHIDVVSRNLPGLETDRGTGFIEVSAGQGKAAAGKQSTPKGSESCVVCHQTYQPQGKSDEEYVTRRPKNLPDDAFWLKKGTFKTAPTNHALCFTCHSQSGDIKPVSSDCNACHKLLASLENVQATPSHFDFDPKLAAFMGITDRTILDKWRRRQSSGTFPHEGGEHPNQGCTDCHRPAAMNTLDERTLKVPVLACGGKGTGCHIEATTDGILNFEIDKKRSDPAFQCTKCHVTFGREPIPGTHIKAIPAGLTPK